VRSCITTCPLATFARASLGLPYVEMYGATMRYSSVPEGGEDEQEIELPAWCYRYVTVVDEQKYRQITAQEAITLLGAEGVQIPWMPAPVSP
jgi:hypothetical protein